jgi:phosphoadenosine phosphosulfate reductase
MLQSSQELQRSQASETVARLQSEYGHLRGQSLLRATIGQAFAGEIAMVSSFGAESAVLLHMVAEIDPATPVLFLDTGMLFEETLAYRDELVGLLGLTDVRSLPPEPRDVADLDPDGTLHQRNVDACCYFRKVVPLRKALAPFSAWISGRKRYQAESRGEIRALERDGRHIKVNPLIDWSHVDVMRYVTARGLPSHPLLAEGYASIGCRPCTTPIAAGEDLRAGRWRGTEKSECGIHVVDGRIVRSEAAA